MKSKLFRRDSPDICHQMRANVLPILNESDSHEKTQSFASVSRSAPIIDAPHDTNCTPPQVIRHSFPMSTQYSPTDVNATAPGGDQNVFRQRLVVSPNKRKAYEISNESPHRRTITNSITPTSFPSQAAYLSSQSDISAPPSHIHTPYSAQTKNQVSPPRSSSDFKTSFVKIPSLITLSDAQVEHAFLSNHKTESSPKSVTGATASSASSSASSPTIIPSTSSSLSLSCLRSARGRSRGVVRTQIPSLSSSSELSTPTPTPIPTLKDKTTNAFRTTVSTRGGGGGAKQRIVRSNHVTKHVYTGPPSSTRNNHHLDVYNLQMLSKPSQPSSRMNPHSNYLQPSLNNTPSLSPSSYPVAIAVSRKTKRFRPHV